MKNIPQNILHNILRNIFQESLAEIFSKNVQFNLCSLSIPLLLLGKEVVKVSSVWQHY